MAVVLHVDLTADDLISFRRHCRDTVPALRRRIRLLQCLAAATSTLSVIALILLARPHEGAQRVASVPTIIACIGLVLVAWQIVPPLVGWLDARRIRASTKDGDGRRLQPLQLWVDQWGVYEESRCELVRYNWTAVHRVEETDTHAYVHVGGDKALIVPKRGREEELRVFLTDLAMYQARAAVVAPAAAVSGT